VEGARGAEGNDGIEGSDDTEGGGGVLGVCRKQFEVGSGGDYCTCGERIRVAV
jgi:hypothetical protein